MLIIPAIDLKDGRVVRLYQGRKEQETVYSNDPVEIAIRWAKQGALLIHVVDLDGALWGEPKNIDTLREIIKAVDIPVEFGGGVRTEEIIKKVLRAGACRVTLGTVAFENKELFIKLIQEYKEKIILSVDISSGGKVAIKGWTKETSFDYELSDFAGELSGMGITEIIYTDIERDGTLSGPRIELLENKLAVLKRYGIKVIMAGGVSSLQDIKSLKKLEGSGLEGVIVGKALYERKFELSEAIAFA